MVLSKNWEITQVSPSDNSNWGKCFETMDGSLGYPYFKQPKWPQMSSRKVWAVQELALWKTRKTHNSNFSSHHSTLSWAIHWAILSIASLPRTATRPHFLGGPCSPEAPPHAMRRTCRSPPLIMAEGLTLQRHCQTLPGPIFFSSAQKIGLMMVSLKAFFVVSNPETGLYGHLGPWYGNQIIETNNQGRTLWRVKTHLRVSWTAQQASLLENIARRSPG